MAPKSSPTDTVTDPSPEASVPPTTEQTHHNFTTDVPSSTHIFPTSRLSDDTIRSFAGATAGIASGVITCPLDVIKTKLQAQGGFRKLQAAPPTVVYKGFIGSGRTIWRNEGLRGLYRGLGPIVLGYLPTWAVYFTVYEKSKVAFGKTELGKHQWLVHLLSAMTAGGSSTIATNPIWVIKTRLMSQTRPTEAGKSYTPWHYTSTIDAARKMYKQEGIRSFYSGLGPALLGLTHVAVQFPLYEFFKRKFGGHGLGEGEPQVFGVLAASILSKLFASSATYPHEVVRTRLQTQHRPNGHDVGDLSKMRPEQMRYRGLLQTVKTIYLEEGWRAFYVGMGTNMIRAVPASCVTLVTYEFVAGTLMKWKKEELGLAAGGA